MHTCVTVFFAYARFFAEVVGSPILKLRCRNGSSQTVLISHGRTYTHTHTQKSRVRSVVIHILPRCVGG